MPPSSHANTRQRIRAQHPQRSPAFRLDPEQESYAVGRLRIGRYKAKPSTPLYEYTPTQSNSMDFAPEPRSVCLSVVVISYFQIVLITLDANNFVRSALVSSQVFARTFGHIPRTNVYDNSLCSTPQPPSGTDQNKSTPVPP